MFIAFIMKPMGDIDWIRSFDTELEADAFSIEQSAYSDLDPIHDKPNHWELYDPPVVIVFEAEDSSAYESGKYKRPVAIYQRGAKYPCHSPQG